MVCNCALRDVRMRVCCRWRRVRRRVGAVERDGLVRQGVRLERKISHDIEDLSSVNDVILTGNDAIEHDDRAVFGPHSVEVVAHV